MTYLIMGLALLISLLIQIQSPCYAIMGGAKMPFLLSVVIYYALNRGGSVMLISAVLSGFFQDSLSGVPMGYSSLLFCFVGLIVSGFRSYVITESMITPVFFGGVASMVFTLCIYLLLSREGLVFYPLGRLVVRILGSGFLGMVAAPLVFLMISGMDQLVGNIEVKEDIDVFE